jgi:uncharacterized membrane protein
MVTERENARLEAFCDGVFAIALTLLIIDVKIPSTTGIASTADLWRALQRVFPQAFAFLLSFVIILITWVNHHAALRLVDKSSASFIYANGLLLLTVVFIPFPTALLGDYVFTPYATPAVVLFNTVATVQGVAWILLTGAALRNKLTRNEKAAATLRENHKYAYFAVVLYSLLALMALWFPLAIAVVTTVIWAFWLWLGISMKRGDVS